MDRLKGQLCYLSGPMDRTDWKSATEWRDNLKPVLLDLQVGILDPCDKACAFGAENEGTKEKVDLLKSEGRYNKVRELMKPICAIDLRMVDIAHFLVLYVDLDIHMTGSYNEAFLAVNQKKPVLTMCKQGKENLPNWLFGVMPHEMMFSNWEDLQAYLYFINNSKQVDHMNRWRFLDMDYIHGSAPRSESY